MDNPRSVGLVVSLTIILLIALGAFSAASQNMAIPLLFVVAALAILFAYLIVHMTSIKREMEGEARLINQNMLIAKLDKSGKVIDISDDLCRFLGISKNKITGKQSNFFINSEFNQITPKEIMERSAGNNIWEGDIRLNSRDGKAHWIHSRIYPDRDEEQTIHGYTNLIQDITAEKALAETSITDEVTKLYNRHHFEEVIEKEFKVNLRKDEYMAVALVNIDNFSEYNQYNGRFRGNQTLAKVGQAIQRNFRRSNDYVFRLDGARFVVIFSGLDANQSKKMLKQVRKNIEGLKIKHIQRKTSKYVTASIGLATERCGNVSSSYQLFIDADRALFRAKSEGNCLILATQVHETHKAGTLTQNLNLAPGT